LELRSAVNPKKECGRDARVPRLKRLTGCR